MKNINSAKKLKWTEYLPVTITWICIIAQIVLTFAIWGNYYELNVLLYIGYGLWGIAAVFGILPIITFRKKGGVEKGESYIRTTQLVETGLYAIVRHPQYIAGVIISISLAFMSQHWVVDILVIPTIVCTYIDTWGEEKKLLEKFGEEYIEYQKKVPRITPIIGILKLVSRKVRKLRKDK